MDVNDKRRLLKDFASDLVDGIAEDKISEDLVKGGLSHQENVVLAARNIIALDMVNPGIIKREVLSVFGNSSVKLIAEVMNETIRISKEKSEDGAEGKILEDLVKKELNYQEKVDIVARKVIAIGKVNDMVSQSIVEREVIVIFGNSSRRIIADVLNATIRVSREEKS